LFNIRLKKIVQKKITFADDGFQVMVSGGTMMWASRMLWRVGTLWWERGWENFWGEMERSEFLSSYAVSVVHLFSVSMGHSFFLLTNVASTTLAPDHSGSCIREKSREL
jgi:hypothetical protein